MLPREGDAAVEVWPAVASTLHTILKPNLCTSQVESTCYCGLCLPSGAVNAANEKVNAVVNVLTGEEDAVPATARYYKSKGLPWVVIGELEY